MLGHEAEAPDSTKVVSSVCTATTTLSEILKEPPDGMATACSNATEGMGKKVSLP